MNQPAPLISLVDDDASFLAAMSRLLRATGYAVKTFSSAHEYLTTLTDTPGCVILDLRMPGLDGLDLQTVLAARDYACPIIFLSAEGDIPTSVRAMRRGAEDFLTKDAPKAELLQAIERALARDAVQREQRLRLRGLRDLFAMLTARESEVLEHVVRGRMNKQIAADLGITERTVKLHRTAITSKLGVRSVAELTKLVHTANVK